MPRLKKKKKKGCWLNSDLMKLTILQKNNFPFITKKILLDDVLISQINIKLLLM